MFLRKLRLVYESTKLSGAADVYLKGKSCYIGIQIRSGQEKFRPSSLAKETQMSILSSTQPFVFILACMNLPQHFKNNKDKCPFVTDDEGKELAIQYNPNSIVTYPKKTKQHKKPKLETKESEQEIIESEQEIIESEQELIELEQEIIESTNSYQVPDNVQIIILLDEGMKSLIGDMNYRLINGEDPFNVIMERYFELPAHSLLREDLKQSVTIQSDRRGRRVREGRRGERGRRGSSSIRK